MKIKKRAAAKEKDKQKVEAAAAAAATAEDTVGTSAETQAALTAAELLKQQQIEENNNVNTNVIQQTTTLSTGKALKSTTKLTQRTDSDEVIEEFDFSDSDLRELSDEEMCENAWQPIKLAQNAIIATTANVLSKEINYDNNKTTSMTTTTTTLATQQTNAEIEKDALRKETKNVDNNSDVEAKKKKTNEIIKQANVDNVIVEQDDAKKNEEFTAALPTTPPALTMPPAAGNKTTGLPSTTADNDALDTSTYCPITPRLIVDVNEDEQPQFISKRKTMTIKALDGNVVSQEHNNNDYIDNDDVEDDEPEDELLVQFLGEANRIAEARLAARRQARAEAREIRMRELERQQKEQEQSADRVFDMHNTSASGTSIDALARTRLSSGVPNVGGLLNATRVVNATTMSSRRSSEDSLEEEGRSLRDIKHELKDVEERFRKAMIANAQLDNDRASQTYEVKLLKDKIETIQESYTQLTREHNQKIREFNALKRNLDRLTLELKLVQGQLDERDTLITEQGLVIVAVENADGTDAKRALVSVENANVLASVQGSLDVRLKKFNEEKQQLLGEVQKLQNQLDVYKSEGKIGRGNSLKAGGPIGSDEDYEAQREANKIISDYKYKLQKAEQEIASLQASLARSESQVIRYKSTAEAAEKAEAELKVERRKLQRENREVMERLEELETSNNHLLKRLDKLKNAKSALLKDL